ncbi:MAG: glycosyltransferase involved in cell wall biosynthesis [Candidatus Paceibacteria bacterium]|jgi:glycosyltransferase involved in cell wall biosynthesis
MSTAPRKLLLLANARLPSQRAQSLQVAQVAGAFARCGLETTLVHALRRDTPAVTSTDELWDYYALPPGARPAIHAVRNLDWIDAVPRSLQYIPARIQELTFARGAARFARLAGQNAWLLCRELESALQLVRGGHPGVFIEIHRVPGGQLRRGWLLQSARKAAGIIAISGGVREDLVALGIDPQSIFVAHDGYESTRFQDMPSKSLAREELGLGQEDQVVVYTGGLLAWKGVDILVQAARSLPEVRFVIAGGMDADVAGMKQLAGDLKNVRFDGFQSPARVATYLAAADVGVVPNRSAPAISARYTSPLKVFEAKAAGLPLVVSDLFSLRDVLHGDEAVFVEADSPGALAAGLSKVLSDEELRSRMAKSIRANAPEHTWDARAERLLGWMGARTPSSMGK